MENEKGEVDIDAVMVVVSMNGRKKLLMGLSTLTMLPFDGSDELRECGEPLIKLLHDVVGGEVVDGSKVQPASCAANCLLVLSLRMSVKM